MNKTKVLVLSLLTLAFCARNVHAQDPGTTVTLPVETGNNTSACSADGTPSYCNEAFPGFKTNPNNTSAQTQTVDPQPGHVSAEKLSALMYSGFTGKFLCEYQPWFDNVSPYNGHKDIGYDENMAATVEGQDNFMITEGCYVNFVDFYGTQDPSQAFNLATTVAVYKDLSTRTGTPLKLGILEDEGATIGICDDANYTLAQEESCVVTDIEADMAYINTNWEPSAAFWKDGGVPVIGFFGSAANYKPFAIPAADWNTMWAEIQAYTNTFKHPFKYIFQFGSYGSPSASGGEYGWPQPAVFSESNPQTQYWWCSPTGTACSGYLDYFYQQGAANPSDVTVGVVYKGFDDSNASWGSNRIIAQQCGQVLLNTAKEISALGYFGTSNQIPYVQIATWNDYEEGTEVETGIDNCYTISATVDQSTNKVNWTLPIETGQASYASLSTIHHFTVYYENPSDPTQTLTVLESGISRDATSYSLTKVPAGTWNIYVEMVGEPLILNRMSNPSTYTAP
jgi:hypothetical protein